MNGRFSRYQTNRWLSQLADRSLYISLFTADPYSVADPLTVELLTGSVVRQPSEWAMTSPYTLEMQNDVFFQAIPPETMLTAVGAFDGPVNGNLLFRDLLVTPDSKPIYLSTGGSFSISAGQFIVGLDIPT